MPDSFDFKIVDFNNGLQESYLNQISENIENVYKSVIKTFYNNIKAAISGKEEKKVRICAISRKTPKMLQLLLQDFGANIDRAEIISELAIPFLQWDEIEDIILLDDAIYYGSTFNNIYNLITEYKAEIKIIPMTCIKASEAPVLRFDNDLKTNVKPRGFGHYFVNKLSNDFFQLGTPFEVEFPLFYINLPRDMDEINFESEMKKVFGDQFYEVPFRCDNYTLTKQIKGTGKVKGYALNLNEGCTAIRKFRFYIKNNLLTIASFFPQEIIHREMENNTLFEETIYKSMWNIIRHGLYPLEKNNSMIEDSRYKGLCMWANYLFSLDLFLEYRLQLLQIIKKAYNLENTPQILLNKKDLTLIIGKDKSDVICTLLAEIATNYDNNNASKKTIPSQPNEVLPKEYLLENMQFPTYYYTSQKKLLEQSKNLNEALSTVYFLQNAILDKMNRPLFVLDSKRLIYGNTFAALKELLKSYCNIENDNGIHQWVDSFIDRATVVPQYIHVANNEPSGKWVRVFRSGENEVPFISHFARYFLKIYLKTQELTGLNLLSKSLFQSLTSAVTLGDILKDSTSIMYYFHYNMKIIHEPGLYKLVLCDVTENSYIEILDILVRMNIFLIDNNEYVSIHPDLLDEELKERTILPEILDEQLVFNVKNILKQLRNADEPQRTIPFFNLFFSLNKEEIKEEPDTSKNHIFDLIQKVISKETIDSDIQDNLMLLRRKQIIRSLENQTYKKLKIGNSEDLTIEQIGNKINQMYNRWDYGVAVEISNIINYCSLEGTGKIIIDKLRSLNSPIASLFNSIIEVKPYERRDKEIRITTLQTILKHQDSFNELFA